MLLSVVLILNLDMPSVFLIFIATTQFYLHIIDATNSDDIKWQLDNHNLGLLTINCLIQNVLNQINDTKTVIRSAISEAYEASEQLVMNPLKPEVNTERYRLEDLEKWLNRTDDTLKKLNFYQLDLLVNNSEHSKFLKLLFWNIRQDILNFQHVVTDQAHYLHDIINARNIERKEFLKKLRSNDQVIYNAYSLHLKPLNDAAYESSNVIDKLVSLFDYVLPTYYLQTDFRDQLTALQAIIKNVLHKTAKWAVAMQDAMLRINDHLYKDLWYVMDQLIATLIMQLQRTKEEIPKLLSNATNKPIKKYTQQMLNITLIKVTEFVAKIECLEDAFLETANDDKLAIPVRYFYMTAANDFIADIATIMEKVQLVLSQTQTVNNITNTAIQFFLATDGIDSFLIINCTDVFGMYLSSTSAIESTTLAINKSTDLTLTTSTIRSTTTVDVGTSKPCVSTTNLVERSTKQSKSINLITKLTTNLTRHILDQIQQVEYLKQDFDQFLQDIKDDAAVEKLIKAKTSFTDLTVSMIEANKFLEWLGQDSHLAQEINEENPKGQAALNKIASAVNTFDYIIQEQKEVLILNNEDEKVSKTLILLGEGLSNVTHLMTSLANVLSFMKPNITDLELVEHLEDVSDSIVVKSFKDFEDVPVIHQEGIKELLDLSRDNVKAFINDIDRDVDKLQIVIAKSPNLKRLVAKERLNQLIQAFNNSIEILNSMLKWIDSMKSNSKLTDQLPSFMSNRLKIPVAKIMQTVKNVKEKMAQGTESVVSGSVEKRLYRINVMKYTVRAANTVFKSYNEEAIKVKSFLDVVDFVKAINDIKVKMVIVMEDPNEE